MAKDIYQVNVLRMCCYKSFITLWKITDIYVDDFMIYWKQAV